MAWMAGREAWQARCLREKRARKRRARGEDSLVRVLRRARTVGSSVGGGEVADGAMFAFVVMRRCRYGVGRNLFRSEKSSLWWGRNSEPFSLAIG